MAMSKAERKAEKAAANVARKKAREEAKAEVVIAKGRAALGFAGTYLLTQMLPSFAPQAEARQTTIDAGIAIAGGYLAYTNDDALGDYAFGAALVGAIQTLDSIGARVKAWFAARQSAAAA